MSTPSFLRVLRIESVLGIHERRQTPGFLRLGNDLQCNGGLAGRLWTEDFDHPAARHAAHPQRRVKGDGSGRDDGNRDDGLFAAEAHDGTLAELLFNLR